MPLQVEIFERLTDIPRTDWNAAVSSSNANSFYDYDLLAAYERFPLEPHLAQFYLLARDDADRRPCALVPAYCYEPLDTYGDLDRELPPAATRSRGLLTHFWHCYDSQLPRDSTRTEIVAGICSAMRRLAVMQGAAWFGFLNVSDAVLRTQLQDAGMQSFRMPDRYALCLDGEATFSDYVRRLKWSRRREILRQRRLAQEAAASIRVTAAPFNGISEVVALCRSTAARHQFESYYPTAHLTGFLQEAGPLARLVTVHQDRELVGAIIAFIDGERTHAWAGGARYDLTRYSPWAVALLRAIELGIDSGSRTFEAGRSNGEVKRRYGLQPISQFALLANV
jgi:predicted N-acyltransferase